jgi:hypothetical protein
MVRMNEMNLMIYMIKGLISDLLTAISELLYIFFTSFNTILST